MTATGTEFVAVIGDYVEGQPVTGVTLRARLTEGRFPRWRDVDKSHDTPKSLVVAGDLLHAIDMASICTSESSKGVTVAISEEGLTISARAAARSPAQGSPTTTRGSARSRSGRRAPRRSANPCRARWPT